jgi:hypothetical protein
MPITSRRGYANDCLSLFKIQGTVVRSIRDSRSSTLASLASMPRSFGSFAWVMMRNANPVMSQFYHW